MESIKWRFVLHTNLVIYLVMYWKLVEVYFSNWKILLFYSSIQILLAVIGMQMLLALNMGNHIQEQ